jgi:hypothetical protein
VLLEPELPPSVVDADEAAGLSVLSVLSDVGLDVEDFSAFMAFLRDSDG